VKTLLLLAGRSRRFWPLADKTLLSLCGKTVTEHQVERLRSGGCDDITLIVGAHNTEALARMFPEMTIVEQEDMDQGMRGALLSALPACGDAPVLIVSGNDVIDPAAYRDVMGALKTGIDGAILAAEVERHFPGGYLTLDGNRITGIVEKPKPGEEPSNLVNIVAHAHRSASELLAMLQETPSEKDDAYEVALHRLLGTRRYVAVPYAGHWQPIKYPWHVLPLLEMFLKDVTSPSIHPTAIIHPSAVIEGNVVIGEGARVLHHATVVGPCVIGARTVVATNALVRQASVGEDCVVGFASEVKSSVLGKHVWTHSTYIGDSVIGSNVSFGAGSVTGNLRLDEREIQSRAGDDRIATGLNKFGTIIGDHCRIGIHCGINPGLKIGGGTFIASGALVSDDVPDNSFVMMKQGMMDVRPNTAHAPRPEERVEFRRKI
jgi:bifunctional UDP-N-acetylglucosamine pyrophosphorylase/glucosamine-1-phosphate N-acetyltransferase